LPAAKATAAALFCRHSECDAIFSLGALLKNLINSRKALCQMCGSAAGTNGHVSSSPSAVIRHRARARQPANLVTVEANPIRFLSDATFTALDWKLITLSRSLAGYYHTNLREILESTCERQKLLFRRPLLVILRWMLHFLSPRQVNNFQVASIPANRSAC
jgi:hypothetical protein